MSSPAIVTMTKMMETLPEAVQDQALAHFHDYIAEIQAEKKWDKLFDQTQNQLIAAAKQARKEIAAGQAEPLDIERL